MRSVLVVDAGLFTDPLQHSHRQMYGALLAFADAKGTCWPTIKGLASRLGIDGRHVRRVLAQMASTGLIAREKLKSGRWRYVLRKYFIPPGDSESSKGSPEEISKTESPAAREVEENNDGNPGALALQRSTLGWMSKLEQYARHCGPEEYERWIAHRWSMSAEARAYRNDLDRRMRESPWHDQRLAGMAAWARRHGITLPRRSPVKIDTTPIAVEPLPPDELQQQIQFINRRFPREQAEAMLLELMSGNREVAEKIDQLRRLECQ